MASKGNVGQNLELPFSFSTNFLKDHAGHIISDPKTAITELIANAYDAGATAVDITWPDDTVGLFAIADNGTGMTKEEFNRRWRTLSYDRLKEQGVGVEFPPGVPKRHRTAFGRNGKGRHAAFCFSDRYLVETRKDGRRLVAEVSVSDGGDNPFRCSIIADEDAPEYAPGTTVSAELIHGLLSEDEILEVIGTRFIVDPSFAILLNGHPVQLFDLQTLTTDSLTIDPHGVVEVYILDAASADRSSRLKGLTWWVNDRMVGEPSWEGLDGEGSILERLTLISKLQGLIHVRETDEVHELQPLFERGLWMFGPEYEAVDFRSNRGMAEVIRNFFGKTGADVSRNRPDFVALTESSIGAYAADHYAETRCSLPRN